MKNISTLIIFIFSTATLFAQAPQSFNYQGVARTLDGIPVLNQNISLQISILETNANGAAVYTETHSVQTNDLGLFNLQIGMGMALSGTFSDINWGGDNHFVQIEMDENGGSNYQLIGTSQLLSVPYALHAGNGSLWKDLSEMPNQYGFSSGAFYKVDNSSIIIGKQNEDGLTYPSYPRLSMYEEYTDTQFGDYAGASILLIRKAEYHDEPTLEFAYGYTQGTDRNFSFKTNGTSKLFIEGTGNIGIGTNTPSRLLHLKGSNAVINIERNTHSPAIQFFNYNENSWDINDYELGFGIGVLEENLPHTPGGLFISEDMDRDFATGDYDSDDGTHFVIQKGGNIGIGVIAPKSKLQVTGGDIYIEDINHGVIMKSPDGQCWRFTVNNSGQLESSATACPN